jgi:8-amino-3,8-dideoxy-alpha-D-manno-octulosonate transaminase
MKTAARLAISLFKAPQDYENLQLPKSYDIISRLISIQIRITWTEEEIQNLTAKIEGALNEVFK